MSNEKLTLTNREWYTAKAKRIIENLHEDSIDFIALLLYMPISLENYRSPIFSDNEATLYDQAIKFGEPLPDCVLAVYIIAIVDILEKRFKE